MKDSSAPEFSKNIFSLIKILNGQVWIEKTDFFSTSLAWIPISKNSVQNSGRRGNYVWFQLNFSLFLIAGISPRSYVDVNKYQEKTDEIGRKLFNLSNYSILDVAKLVYGKIIESLPQTIVFYALYGLWVLFVALISWIFNFQTQDMLDNIILYIWNQFIDAISN